MRILIVGAGSTGGYFGGRLAEAGRDVTFLVRPARAEQLRRDGLQIVSPHGDAAIVPRLATAGRIDGTFDMILLTVKAYALDRAMEDFAPAVGPQSMIVPVLNGMRHIDALVGRFGDEAVLGGVCRVATMLDDQGRIVQLAEMQDLAYGERSGAMSPRLAALDAVMQGAGFKAWASPAILQDMWEKWVFLAALGAITCLMRGTVGQIEAAPGGADLARQALQECAAVPAASGYPPRDEFLARTRTALTTPGSPLASSMYRDLQRGNEVEADHIVGDLLARSRSFGLAAPILAAAFVNLSVYRSGLQPPT
ncbi:MAG: 2-dehydropantoate 2-reductase [Pseudomonadota bacterium]|nr:2-dehydropantoate 2-reductase [Pseudomonadota bacterium]